MELVLGDAKNFKSCVDAIVNLVDEGTMEVSSEGIHLRTTDPSQIAMVDFVMERKAFEKVDAKESEFLGLNLQDLSKVLARARSGEKLAIKKGVSRLSLDFEGSAKRSFKIPLLDLEKNFPREPKIPFDATVKMSGRELKEMLRDAGLMSSHVTLEANREAFIVEAKGDAGELRSEAKKGSPNIADIEAKESAKAMYAYEYLEDMIKAAPDGEIITIQLKNDAPLRMEYRIGEAKISYYLAPRVERD